MDIVGGAYGGEDPETELVTTLQLAKGWLEGAMSTWEELTEQRKLEMVAAALLSLNRIEMGLEDVRITPRRADDELLGLRVEVPAERPNLVDLTMDERDGEPAARVKLVYREASLLGRSPCRAGSRRDHAAPARATLEALQGVVEESLDLEDARVLQINDGPFAVVTLKARGRLLVGSAMIEDDLGLAMARATLDAANRFINGITRQDQQIQLT